MKTFPNVVTNLNERTQYYASDELVSELKAKMQPNDVVINFAYTDYGGDFFDKVCISYFLTCHPESIVKENTGWSGENAFIFGEVAAEFKEVTESYLLGFESIEEHFYAMESEVRQEGIECFIKDIDMDKFTVSEEIPESFYEWVEGYCNVLQSGLDYSESDMIEKAIETGLITPIVD